MRKSLNAVVALLIVLSASPSMAVVMGPSNLPAGGMYPSPNCPDPSHFTFNIRTKLEKDIAMGAIDEYVKCMNTYIEAANSDKRRISEAASEAKASAERLLNSIGR